MSPYVTECPYCGTRLRKRAPKLERVGDELTPKESRRRKRARRREAAAAERTPRSLSLSSDRPWTAVVAVLVPALLLVIQRAAGLGVVDVGAILGPVGGEWWRYLAAPWVYDDIGYLFVIGLAVAIFVPGLERRLGAAPAAILLVAAGSLGMLAAAGLERAIGEAGATAAGGNGVALGALCAWYVIRRDEVEASGDDPLDRIALAIAAAVLVLLAAVDDWASLTAGLAGAIVGTLAGLTVTMLRSR